MWRRDTSFGTAQATARGRAEALLNRDASNVTLALCAVVTLAGPNRQRDLFLVLAHIENKLACAWLHQVDGGKKFSLIRLQRFLNIMCPITTKDMLRLIASYSWIRLEPKISRLTGHKSLSAMSRSTATGAQTSQLMEMG